MVCGEEEVTAIVYQEGTKTYLFSVSAEKLIASSDSRVSCLPEELLLWTF